MSIFILCSNTVSVGILFQWNRINKLYTMSCWSQMSWSILLPSPLCPRLFRCSWLCKLHSMPFGYLLPSGSHYYPSRLLSGSILHQRILQLLSVPSWPFLHRSFPRTNTLPFWCLQQCDWTVKMHIVWNRTPVLEWNTIVTLSSWYIQSRATNRLHSL